MISLILKLFFLITILLSLPILGVMVGGYPVGRYLEFPPRTQHVHHQPFSWIAFLVFTAIIIAVVLPLIFKWLSVRRTPTRASTPSHPLPWWGWVGIVAGIITWILAWTRFPWFSQFQPHTFFPLWFSFILVVNGFTYRLKGSSMLTRQPGFFFLLFPVSAGFWWFFEYLNRFVQNWHYVGAEFGGLEYFLYATLSFSTVLPGVLSVREWLLSGPLCDRGLDQLFTLKVTRGKVLAAVVLLLSVGGLGFIGLLPNYLFPLLWISPLLVLLSLQTLMGEKHVLSGIAVGDWTLVLSSAIAALVCGWFWEMWNFLSLAKWEYTIAFVQRFHIFEMPVLGYAGYLPFGLECAAVEWILKSALPHRPA